MKIIQKFIYFFIFIFCCSCGHAATEISLSIPKSTFEFGEVFEVPVYVKDGSENISSYALRIEYNANLVHISEIVGGVFPGYSQSPISDTRTFGDGITDFTANNQSLLETPDMFEVARIRFEVVGYPGENGELNLNLSTNGGLVDSGEFQLLPVEMVASESISVNADIDADSDNDNVLDINDNCPKSANLDQLDSDGDGIGDQCDNCMYTANGFDLLDAGGYSQRDTDKDGYGNMCDADIDNDGLVSTTDLTMFRQLMFTDSNPHADFDGDGVVSTSDLTLFREMIFQEPGPSAIVE